MPTYRTNGAWGSGIGVNLTPAQVDANFYELRTDLNDVIANPPTADSIVSVSQSGFNLTFHTTLGNELGPIAIPIVYTVWRGDWAPFTLYSAADIFRVVDQGIFSVLADHTSAATFDPLATGGSPPEPYYNELIGVSTLPSATTLDELSDVTITGVAGGDLLAWDTGTSQWINQPPGTALSGILALDDLSDVIMTVTNVGDVLRYLGGSPDKGWQPHAMVLDDITDVSAAAPGDGDVLTYQAGSPTGWIAASPAAIPTTLDALTDVVAPSPTSGDLLQFDGADWVNAAGQSISDLADSFLPLVGSDLIEISQSSGSPPGSPPTGYVSRKTAFSDLTRSIGEVGAIWSALDGASLRPASTTTAGWAIGTNFSGFGEVDFWSTVERDANAEGFYFWQKTAAAAERLLFQMYYDGTIDLAILGDTGGTQVFFGAEAGFGFQGTLNNVPFILYTNNDTSLAGSAVVIPVGLQYNVRVADHTSNYSPSGSNGAFEFGMVATNAGAGGLVIVTLPSTAETGWRAVYYVDVAQTLRLQCPASHTIRIGASVSASAGKAESNTIGSAVEIIKSGTNKFVALSSLGTWTVT